MTYSVCAVKADRAVFLPSSSDPTAFSQSSVSTGRRTVPNTAFNADLRKLRLLGPLTQRYVSCAACDLHAASLWIVFVKLAMGW